MTPSWHMERSVRLMLIMATRVSIAGARGTLGRQLVAARLVRADLSEDP